MPDYGHNLTYGIQIYKKNRTKATIPLYFFDFLAVFTVTFTVTHGHSGAFASHFDAKRPAF